MKARRGPPSAVGRLEWLSLPLLILLWEVAALVVDHRLFPTPVEVFREVIHLATERRLIPDVLKTLSRAAAAFVIAMALGIVLGGLTGRFRAIDRLFGSWVLIGLNIPAIVVAITCYIWLGLTETALILAVVINKTPLVTPYVLTAARTGLSLIWKIVLVFEVLGSDGGVGFRIGIFFQSFDIAAILAYTTSFMAVVFFIEYAIMRPLERKVLGWRPAFRSA